MAEQELKSEPTKDASLSTSEATTRNVRVHVEARYSPDHSDPPRREWFFLYTVRITNVGDETVRLLSRHWIITDASGNVEEVRGPGVVGHRPVLAAGQSFEYTSGCPLSMPFGSMHGTYQMVTERGEHFDAEIAPFALSEPGSIE
jgi:ApaG protein